MTLTPAYASTLDGDFIRSASQFMICMNEHLYTRRYGPNGNRRWLQGWGFFERQNHRTICDNLIEGMTGKARTGSRRKAPLHVHLVMEELQLGDLDVDQQQARLRDAARHATSKVTRDKLNGHCGTERQRTEFAKVWNEDGGSSKRTRRLAKRATQVQLFNPNGIDIRPIFNQAPLIDYLSKQLTLHNCQFYDFDFMVPIAPNGFSLAVH